MEAEFAIYKQGSGGNFLISVEQVLSSFHLEKVKLFSKLEIVSKVYETTCCKLEHGLLIEYGPICHIVKLPISMIRPFSLVNNSHITLYPQLEIIWKVSKSLRKYWGKYGQISFYIICCITRDCIIVENIFLA